MSSVCNLCRLEGGQVPDEAFELLEESERARGKWRMMELFGLQECPTVKET